MDSKAKMSREERLVDRAIRGDARAFGLLYERHLDAIYRYIYFRVANAADAEDLTEEVFIRAWEAISAFDSAGQGSFLSWIYRIAHNRVVDHYRKRQPLSWTSDRLALETANSPTVEETTHRNQDAARLAEAISQLDDTEQQVIILRFVEGLPHAEVAQMLGKSEGASRVIQHRALINLKEILDR